MNSRERPSSSKTTAVLDYAKGYHQQQITLRGDTTPDGHRRVPVIYIALTGNTHIKGLNQAICRFYGLPTTGNADTLAFRAVDAVLSLGTQVFVIDDIHFLDMRRRDAQAMANHLKYLSNALGLPCIPVINAANAGSTFVSIVSSAATGAAGFVSLYLAELSQNLS